MSHTVSVPSQGVDQSAFGDVEAGDLVVVVNHEAGLLRLQRHAKLLPGCEDGQRDGSLRPVRNNFVPPPVVQLLAGSHQKREGWDPALSPQVRYGDRGYPRPVVTPPSAEVQIYEGVMCDPLF